MLDAHEQLAVTEGLIAGRSEAWNALYEAYCEDVWRYAARLLGADRESIHDVVQETFLAAARSARRFDPTRGSLRSWLLGIAHLQAAQHFRRRRRDMRAVAHPVGEGGDALSDGDQAAALDRREQADQVRGVLADMAPDNAWLLVAKYVDDLPIAALSAQLNAGTEAVRSKLARARRLFRNAMTRQRVPPGARGNTLK